MVEDGNLGFELSFGGNSFTDRLPKLLVREKHLFDTILYGCSWSVNLSLSQEKKNLYHKFQFFFKS